MYTELLGQILINETPLTADQLAQAIAHQHRDNPRRPLGQILIDQKILTPTELAHALGRQWHISFLETIAPEQLNRELVQNLSLDFLKKHCILPIVTTDDRIVIAVADPFNLEAYDAVLNILDCYCPRVISTYTEIEKAISRCYYQNLDDATQAANTNLASTKPTAQAEDLLDIANQPPIVKLVNNIFFQAVQRRASDIHIEPYDNEVKVRFRIDGVLHDALTPGRDQIAAVISRLKIMANLNIAERRLPQDGQSRIKIGNKEMDIRISIIPTAGGERVVMRLLDKGNHDLHLAQIGFATKTQKLFRNLITQPNGIVLITGPTGSGKTTTLYAALNELNSHETNILTVEDPIEYQLTGIGQMQIKPKINLTFANCLRHLLRQDPDIIMVGEIRDLETAEIAIQASLTGHLVLSTLHTNDSASAFTRLTDMGIEPYLISSSVTAVMAQRLVRLICTHCKEPCDLEQTKNSFQQFYHGLGCDHCLQTGYYSRTGIFELLIVDDDIRNLIIKRTPAHIIKDLAVQNGMITLRDDGREKALTGQTTIEEVLRVTQDNSTLIQEAPEHVIA